VDRPRHHAARRHKEIQIARVSTSSLLVSGEEPVTNLLRKVRAAITAESASGWCFGRSRREAENHPLAS